MDDECTTESALLEWATGTDAALKSLESKFALLQDVVFALCIALFFNIVACCLCPNNKRRVKPYKH